MHFSALGYILFYQVRESNTNTIDPARDSLAQAP